MPSELKLRAAEASSKERSDKYYLVSIRGDKMKRGSRVHTFMVALYYEAGID
jgi:hypothetical protein